MAFEDQHFSERARMKKGEVSIDGKSSVKVPPPIARMIAFTGVLQEKVDRVKQDLESTGLPLDIEDVGEGFNRAVDIVRGINCHKTVLFMRGEIDKELLLQLPTKDRPDLGGHPEILSLSDENPEEHVGSIDELKEYLDAVPEGEVRSVHVLRLSFEEDGVTLVPAHSFLFLGVDELGREVCFHKKGPMLRMRFETTALDNVLRNYHGDEYSFLVLPLASDA